MDKITLKDFLRLVGANYNKTALFYVYSSEDGDYEDYCSFDEKEKTIGNYIITHVCKNQIRTSKENKWREVLCLYLYDPRDEEAAEEAE